VVAGTATAALLCLPGLPALAHVTPTPDSAPAGSAAVVTFHVPNEEAKANVTQVDMQIPTAHPIAQLLVRPIPGWHISVRTVTLAKPVVTDDGRFTQAVTEVIWSGGQIPPGQFQDFAISADPLPQGVSTLAFKTIQTYSNGDVVRWIDLPQPGQPPPDHPAPLLKLTTATATSVASAETSAATAGPGPDNTARYLAAAGLVIALLALATAVVGRRRGSGET
jgi:periplasmic copper chaperone A